MSQEIFTSYMTVYMLERQRMMKVGIGPSGRHSNQITGIPSVRTLREPTKIEMYCYCHEIRSDGIKDQ